MDKGTDENKFLLRTVNGAILYEENKNARKRKPVDSK